jgi:hypothetical protein
VFLLRALHAVALWVLFVLGCVVGLALFALPIFLWALVTKKRPIHFDGVVLRADVEGELLRGPAIVRLSGGGNRENSTARDVLGFALRLQGERDDDLRVGDQDLVFGTFESFITLPFTIKNVKVGDYLANEYSSVTPWRVPGLGCVKLRAMPPRSTVADGADRVARLLADVAAGTAVFALEARGGDTPAPLARIRLVERLPLDGRDLHASMWRNGRGFHPTGFRNGIRAVVYPMSQTARGLRM